MIEYRTLLKHTESLEEGSVSKALVTYFCYFLGRTQAIGSEESQKTFKHVLEQIRDLAHERAAREEEGEKELSSFGRRYVTDIRNQPAISGFRLNDTLDEIWQICTENFATISRVASSRIPPLVVEQKDIKKFSLEARQAIGIACGYFQEEYAKLFPERPDVLAAAPALAARAPSPAKATVTGKREAPEGGKSLEEGGEARENKTARGKDGAQIKQRDSGSSGSATEPSTAAPAPAQAVGAASAAPASPSKARATQHD